MLKIFCGFQCMGYKTLNNHWLTEHAHTTKLLSFFSENYKSYVSFTFSSHPTSAYQSLTFSLHRKLKPHVVFLKRLD